MLKYEGLASDEKEFEQGRFLLTNSFEGRRRAHAEWLGVTPASLSDHLRVVCRRRPKRFVPVETNVCPPGVNLMANDGGN